MEQLRQDIIESLNYRLTENEFITNDGATLAFSDSTSINAGVGGNLTVDGLSGNYKIYFTKSLTLILTSESNFKFSNFDKLLLNSIALEGIDSNAIIDLLKNLLITKI